MRASPAFQRVKLFRSPMFRSTVIYRRTRSASEEVGKKRVTTYVSFSGVGIGEDDALVGLSSGFGDLLVGVVVQNGLDDSVSLVLADVVRDGGGGIDEIGKVGGSRTPGCGESSSGVAASIDAAVRSVWRRSSTIVK